MTVLPPPRRILAVPRPRHGELSGSYLARVAQANQVDLRTFLGLLGTVPAGLSREGPDLAVMVLTLNEAAFARLLTTPGRTETLSSRQSHRLPREPTRRTSLLPSGSRS